MIARRYSHINPALAGVILLAGCVDDRALEPDIAHAMAVVESNGPTLVDNNLRVRTVAGGLITPITMAFIGSNDILILEKNTGRVKRVVNGVVQPIAVLDLAVNFMSERGLLGIALHPRFPANPGVYLYWTESLTGSDTDVFAQTPDLGNRVDRYIWNGSTLSSTKT
jgi:glucose/arabinose dehydrogenase